jgi:pimeloyl-ACP methyl ester carboxylesterase
MTPADRTVELRGGLVRIRVLSGGRGRPLVYFHSFHERGGWSPFLERLAARYAVYAPLHPGVGGSEGVDTLDDLLDLALVYDELLQALGLTTAYLSGHFFGGMMAAELGALFPGRAAGLALCSPLGLWLEQAPVADVAILPREELQALLWLDPEAEVARRWAALPESEEEQVAAQLESIQRLAAMARFVWPIPDKGIRKRLHRIAAPTLLLWGDRDRVNPIVYGEEWQRRIKGSEVRLLPGGHMLLDEAPAAAAEAVAAFLG